VNSITLLSLTAIVLVGMALALSQFCMVRAVLGVREGSVSAARCVLAISLAISLSLQLLALVQGGESRPSYAPAPQVLLGGLLFGIAARRNGGCYVGTLNELSCGQWRRLLTVAGWILAAVLLRLPPLPAHHQRSAEVGLVIAALTALLGVLGWQARRGRETFRPNPAIAGLRGGRAWCLMLATGVLMGLLHRSAWPWDPSLLARELGTSLVFRRPPPLSAACALLLPLGMLMVQRCRHQFQPRRPLVSDLPLLLWGTLMGLGTTLGMGANDTYLFRSLPVGSLHAALGLTAMTIGILLPLPGSGRGAPPHPAAPTGEHPSQGTGITLQGEAAKGRGSASQARSSSSAAQ